MPTKRANTKAARKREEKQSRAGEFDEFNGLDENGIEARSDDDEDDQGSDLDGFIVGEEDDEEVHTPAAATPATRLGIDPSLIIEGKRNRRAPVRYWDEIKDTVQELFQEEETETDEEEIIPVDPATITTATLPEVDPEAAVDEDTEEEEEEAEEDVSEYEESEEEEDPEDDSEDMESEEEDPEEPAPKRRRVNPQPQQQQPRSAGVDLTATAPEIASPQENQQDVLVPDTPVAAESHCRDESNTQESRGTSL